MEAEEVRRIGVRGINMCGRADPIPPFPHFCSIRVFVSREVSQQYFGYVLTVKLKKLLLRSLSPISLLFLHVSGNLPSPCLKTLQHEGVETVRCSRQCSSTWM